MVVDEVVGQWVSLLFLPFTLATAAGSASCSSGPWTSSSPGPRATSSACPGGLGIMADDLMAGVYANLLLRVGLTSGPSHDRPHARRAARHRQRAPGAAALRHEHALDDGAACSRSGSRSGRGVTVADEPACSSRPSGRPSAGRHRGRHRRPGTHRGRPHPRGRGGAPSGAASCATRRYVEALKVRFAKYLRPMAEEQREAGRRHRGRGRSCQNPRGTAPGQWWRRRAGSSSCCPVRPWR